MDIFFVAVFAFEMALKLCAHGIIGYFRSGWNWLDAFIVVIGFLGELKVFMILKRRYILSIRHLACSKYCIIEGSAYIALSQTIEIDIKG